MKRLHVTRSRRNLLALMAILLTLCVGAAIFTVQAHAPSVHHASPAAEPTPTDPLPEARYDAVIHGLVPIRRSFDGVVQTYTLKRDTVLYGSDRRTPVARLPQINFAGRPTIVSGIRNAGNTTLVLTPARQQLPSTRRDDQPKAPAQTAAWVHLEDLTPLRQLRSALTISSERGEITITDQHGHVTTWPAAVGAPGTPTPAGVTGALQERYLDPKQGQNTHRIQLTTLHATSSDEPYRGRDGGLIGIHFTDNPTGSITHGCIRVGSDAITAIDKLPLGTLITLDR